MTNRPRGVTVDNVKHPNRVTIQTSDVLTPAHAAEFLGISRMTLWRWVQKGKIRPVIFDDQTFFHIRELEQLRDVEQTT